MADAVTVKMAKGEDVIYVPASTEKYWAARGWKAATDNKKEAAK